MPKLAASLAQAPAESITAASGGWSEVIAACRFLNNGDFEAGELIRPHRRMILDRSRGSDCVLAIQDTTELDYTPMRSVTDLGPLNDETRRGVHMHGHYVVSEQGLPLGMLGADIMIRDDEDFRQSANRRNLPIEEKESHRWIEGYRRACELACDLPDTMVISVSDREGDIFELYLEWLNREVTHRAEWVVRANQDRVLTDVDEDAPARLFDALRAAPLLGEIEFDVAAKKGTKKVKGSRIKTRRAARTVRQEIRAMEITPRPPQRKGLKLPELRFRAVEPIEVGLEFEFNQDIAQLATSPQSRDLRKNPHPTTHSSISLASDITMQQPS